jgi:integrase
VLPVIGLEKALCAAPNIWLSRGLRHDGRAAPAAQAEVLASASAYWLRHTAGSHMSDRQVDLHHLRDNFGHASIVTTSVYLHTEDDARHAATQDKRRIGWTHKKEPATP